MEVRAILAAITVYLLYQIMEILKDMAAELDALKAEVARGTTVKSSVRALLAAMKARLDELVQNATDLATLKADILEETAKLDANHDDIEAAVVEHTEAEDEEPPPA